MTAPEATPCQIVSMRIKKRIALLAGTIFTLLLVALLAAPLLFRDRIEARLKTGASAAIEGSVEWESASLSFLRDFPAVTLRLVRPTIVGHAPFAGDTLLALHEARLVLDARSVIAHLRRGGAIIVRELRLEQPLARLLVLPDGTANWDIVRADTAGGGERPRALEVTLRDLRIDDGIVTLDDRHARLKMSVTGLQERLTGDFAAERFVLTSRTRADSLSVQFAGIPWLSQARVQLDMDIDADRAANRFTFTNDTLRLNELVLAFAGSVTTGSPDVGLDLTFATAGTGFRDVLSLVPAVYASDFADVQTGGTMSVGGRIRGRYGPQSFPALAIRARVNDGTFRYPALPLPARDIGLDLHVSNPGGSVDRTVVSLQRFHARIGDDPIDARAVLRTPVSDPDLDLRLAGALDLAALRRTLKLDHVQELTGRVVADISTRTRLSDVDARRYGRIAASGAVHVSRLTLRDTSLRHPLAIDTAALRLTPQAAELPVFMARVGSSDVRGTGALDNLLGYLIRGDDLKGRAALRSTRIALDEWRSEETTTTTAVIPVPARIDFALEAAAEQVTFGTLTATGVRGSLRMGDERLTLRELQMNVLQGSVVANGFYDTSHPGKPAIDVELRVTGVDIPAAYAAMATVRTLAPIARWVRGTASGSMTFRGPLGPDMTPVFTAVSGSGGIETGELSIDGAPPLERLADALSLEQLRKPTLRALRASFDIIDGRVYLKPFVVQVAGIDLTTAGSSGVDQSIAYEVALAVPRAALGSAAAGVVRRLARQAGRAAPAIDSGEVVQLTAQVTGTVTSPAVRVNFAGMAASLRDAAASVARQEVASRLAAVQEKADSAADAARERARAEADRIIGEAEQQAASIRAEARALAANARAEAAARADSLLARTSNPAARAAARLATDRMLREGDERADRIIGEADARADDIVARARRQAETISPGSER